MILALAFLSFMGVFSVSILAFTGVGSTTTTIVAARADQLYGADAGMEYGIANLAADTSKCASSGSTYTWPTTTVNGRTITYSCAYVSGGTGLSGSPILGQYGTIVTGASGISSNNNGATNVTFAYNGSVHDAGTLTFGSPTRQRMTVNGNLTVAGACPSANVTYTSPGACTASAALPTLPTIGVYVPSAMAAAPTTSGSCRTYYPGRYGSGSGNRTIPTFSASGQHYLASGVYYINNGTMTLNGTVFGGAKGASETKAMTSVSPCRASDPAGTGYSGSGVSFVLGGTGALRSNNASSRVELYSRVPGGLDAGATAGVNVWAGTTASVIAGSGAYLNSTNPTPGFSATNQNLDFVAHGLTYIPSATTRVNVLNNSEAGGASVFMGGLVTSRLQVTVANGDANKVMTVAGTGGFSSSPRVVTLTSTAADTSGAASGAASTTISATVQPDGTLAVSTWRVT